MTLRGSLSSVVRIFASKPESQLANEIPEPFESYDKVMVYTDGSATNAGMEVARAGAGIWFGEDNQANRKSEFRSH